MRYKVKDLRSGTVFEVDTENIQNDVVVFWVTDETRGVITKTVRNNEHLEDVKQELLKYPGLVIEEYMLLHEAYYLEKYTADRSSYEIERL